MLVEKATKLGLYFGLNRKNRDPVPKQAQYDKIRFLIKVLGAKYAGTKFCSLSPVIKICQYERNVLERDKNNKPSYPWSVCSFYTLNNLSKKFDVMYIKDIFSVCFITLVKTLRWGTRDQPLQKLVENRTFWTWIVTHLLGSFSIRHKKMCGY